jgi:UDP-N-acetylglucosamine--N-acetylmuramyl-(pentapeptide) pyrophosphoryl-undecaprenol N-acetylglucosamine transferase
MAPFISEMEKAYAAADIIVSRAGAMAISEITVMGKPAIFVPYPFAAEDHQTANARKMVQEKAGRMISDRDAREQLVREVISLAAAPEELAEISRNAAALAIRDADVVVAKDIIKTLEYRNRLS